MTEPSISLSSEPFGTLPDGQTVHLHTLKNSQGMAVGIIDYGGIIQKVIVPDRDGNAADVVLGEPDLAGYLAHHPHYGAITGRYANRIANGRFSIDGEEYELPRNFEGRHCLHGGSNGLDKKLWSAETEEFDTEVRLKLSLTSPHLDQGFPGELSITVTYSLNLENELGIEYIARTTEPTVLNLTNHSYFNLGGQDNPSVADHEVCLRAPLFLPTDGFGIPGGEILPVAETPFDFNESTPLADRLTPVHPQQELVGGFDHSWIFGLRDPDRAWDCRVTHPTTGRTMEVLTTEPAVQFYTSNSLGKTDVPGKNGKRPLKHQALCLETQHLPDSPNHPHFPSTRLNPGDTFWSHTLYRFGTA